MSDHNRHLLALSAQIVAAHTGHNDVGIDVLPDMIRDVYNVLAGLDPSRSRAPVAPLQAYADAEEEPAEHDHDEHAGHAPDRAHNVYVHPTYGQTVFGDHLICMEDGLTMKMLKRHLLTVHGMTPEEYRAKWGLPPDYPMVAKEYAKLRSSLALQSGLGLKPDDRPGKRKARKG